MLHKLFVVFCFVINTHHKFILNLTNLQYITPWTILECSSNHAGLRVFDDSVMNNGTHTCELLVLISAFVCLLLFFSRKIGNVKQKMNSSLHIWANARFVFVSIFLLFVLSFQFKLVLIFTLWLFWCSYHQIDSWM